MELSPEEAAAGDRMDVVATVGAFIGAGAVAVAAVATDSAGDSMTLGENSTGAAVAWQLFVELSLSPHLFSITDSRVSFGMDLTLCCSIPIFRPSLRNESSERFWRHSVGLPKVFSVSFFNS